MISGIRKLIPEDIREIENDLVESRNNWELAAMVEKIGIPDPAYTYLKDGKVVACCGAVKLDSGDWGIWALYSKKFSCFTRCRAALEFRKQLPEIGNAKIFIPSDLPNGAKYAKFLGAKYIRPEMSKVWANIHNDIYEVCNGH